MHGSPATRSRRGSEIAYVLGMGSSSRFALVLAVLLAASQAMCGSDAVNSNFTPTEDGGADGGDGLGEGGFGGGGNEGGVVQGAFDVQPSALQTITVATGQTMPTVPFTATLGGQPVAVGWSVDRGDIGSIPAGPSPTASFAPKGATGGLVSVVAGLNGTTVTRQVLVKLTGTQNGANAANPAEAGQIPANVAALKAGGGVGGVGGEGLGPPVTDAPTLAALAAPSGNGSAQNLALLYPYDKTVWPRGMLAPLLMWRWTPADADAIRIELKTTSGSFTWSGTFGRPAILTSTGGAFIRHPIPQDIWTMATDSAGGPTSTGTPDKLTMTLTVAKAGVAYGPITQTWPVAPARLSGSVYYNSYGTQLVKNWTALDSAGHSVGAAILGVRSGDLGPKLIVGKNSPVNAQGNPADDSGCRVCHVVASRGRWLLTQSEQGSPGDGRSFLYDLTAADVQASVAQIPQEGSFAWAGMVGDGSSALTNTVNPSSTNPAITNSSAGSATSSFWSFGATPTAATLTGLPAGASAGYPSYSPDDKQMTYIDVAGSTQDVKGPLMVSTYNATTKAFGAPQNLHTPAAGQRVGFPVFLPDNSGIVFETEVRTSQSDSVMVTRNGARSELWWVKTAGGAAARLDTLNGKSGAAPYIPIGANNHGIAGASDPRSSYNETGFDDTTLAYEPTVLPIVSGGYAWVVFTSRRLYGNQLTSVPWQSWPPDYDTTDLSKATTKKLWVAAIDLSAPAGADPSHPAFYLPAQEILAGNSRGFWVLDPCKADGQTCQSGDQCCNGYCGGNGASGALVCSNVPPNNNCAGAQDKCATANDCCDKSNQCINGFCAAGVH
jgi:hypothetical protein